MEATSERRAQTRVLHEVPISFTSQNTFYTGLTRDVSIGGVFIATEDLSPPGTHVAFELTLGHAVIRVPMTGMVRWVRTVPSGGLPVGMGVEYDPPSPRLLARIEAFVEKRESLYYDDEE